MSLSDPDLDALLLHGEPLVMRIGSAEVLGRFAVADQKLVIELAHIDGGGEGVLLSLWLLAEQYARRRSLPQMEWIVHAVNCANPNPKLRRVLERRGFRVEELPGIGEAFHLIHPLTKCVVESEAGP